MTGALNQRLRPLGHATDYILIFAIPYFWASVQSKVNKIRKKHTFGRIAIRTQAIEMTTA